MESLIVGQGSLKLREVVNAIEKSASFGQLVPKWRSFGVKLDLMDEDLEDLQLRVNIGTFQIGQLPREVLAIWKANNGTQATLQKLCKTFEDCGVRDIADTLNKKFNQSESDEYMLNGKVYTLNQLVGNNASEEISESVSKTRKLKCPKKALPLLREEVSVKEQPEYYIPRALVSRTELDHQIFRDDSAKEHVFAVKGISKSELARVSSFQLIERSKSQLEMLTVRFILLDHKEDFENICKNTTKPVHMVEFNEGRFHWLRSTHGMDAIRKFLKKDSHEYECVNVLGEEEAAKRIISSQSPSVFTISESPGMGKTMVLNSLALKIRESKPEAVIIFLVLQEFVKQIYSTQLTSPDFHCILTYVTTDYWKKLILQHMLQSSLHQLYLFFDGYDEIFQENLDFVDSLLQNLLQMRNIKIILTTRRHLTSRVEHVLKTVALEMLPFNESNQIDFLSRYWVTKHGAKEGESLQAFAKKCLNALQTKMTDGERNIAGIPLQCMMLAEVYADSAKRASELQEHFEDAISVEDLSIFHLYKSLINFRFGRIPDSRTRRKYMDAHVYNAIALLFPERLEKFIPLLNPQDDVEENTLFSIGLIEKSPFSRMPSFVHRTFAEYLLADFLIRHIYKNETCVEFVIQQIFGGMGVIERRTLNPIHYGLKHSVIAYFLNWHLQDRFLSAPATLNSFNLQNLSAENICIAAVSCCCNDLEACFAFLANTIIPQFKTKDKKKLKDKYLLHLAVENSNSVSFIQEVLSLTNLEFGVSLKYHVYEDDYKLETGLYIPNCTPLHIAVWRGKYNIVMYLLQEYGQDVFTIKHLLHVCVFRSFSDSESVIQEKLAIIEALTQLNKEWLEEERDSRTPLLELDVHVRIAKHLVLLGANINAHSAKYGDVLDTAGDEDSYTDLVRWALRNGFDLAAHKNKDGTIPLMRAIEKFGTVDDEVLQLFYEAGANFNDQDVYGESVLFYALEHSESLLFLQKILDFRANLKHRNKRGENAAHFVFQCLKFIENHINPNLMLDIVKLLKSRGFNGFNEKDKSRNTPIMTACISGVTLDDETLEFLDGEGVDFNAQDNFGNSILFYAVRENRGSETLKFIQKILECGADPNHTNRKGQNVAHSVMGFSHDITFPTVEILQLLKENGFSQLDKKDGYGHTPLMTGIWGRCFLEDEILQFFHEEKVNFNAQDYDGDSVLFYAIQVSNPVNLTQKILEFGGNPNHKGEFGRNAAHVVLEYHKNEPKLTIEMLKLLKSRGFDGFDEKNHEGFTPIMTAIRSKGVLEDEILKFLSEEAVDFNAQDNDGNSVLFCAIRHTRKLNFIQRILDLGANPNHTNLKGQNAGHWVILSCDRDGCEYEDKQEDGSEEENPNLNFALEIVKLLESKGFKGSMTEI